jgi:hypothetical protein
VPLIHSDDPYVVVQPSEILHSSFAAADTRRTNMLEKLPDEHGVLLVNHFCCVIVSSREITASRLLYLIWYPQHESQGLKYIA